MSPSMEVVGLTLAIRFILGLIFLTSAFGKFFHLPQFNQAVVEYDILPPNLARFYGALLPWLEIFIASVLLVGVWLRIAGIGAAFLLLSFTVAVGSNLKRNRVLECHCYGILNSSKIGWGIVIRNVLLVVFALFLSITSPNDSLNYGYTSFLSSMDFVIPLSLLVSFGFVILRLVEEAGNAGHGAIQLRRELRDAENTKL